MEIREILDTAVRVGASDIHIVPESAPFTRINGIMERMNIDTLSNEDTQEIIFNTLPDDLVEKFSLEGELDASIGFEGLGRFRINVFHQKDGLGAVLRVIPSEIPQLEDLRLEKEIIELTRSPRGMILVTGPTGCGKSTTLATMVNFINQERSGHILTLEDPIEYVYSNLSSVVTQREIGTHSTSFREALKRAMRQDPDVVLVGEMRDLETIEAGLTLAETGHLVFATLHTTDAPQTVDRMIEVFPAYQQQQIRVQLASVLRAVICQQLLPRTDGGGRIAAREIMLFTPAIGNLIREGKTHQLYGAIEMGTVVGMKSLDRDLAQLVKRGAVDINDALAKANDKDLLKRLVQGGL